MSLEKVRVLVVVPVIVAESSCTSYRESRKKMINQRKTINLRKVMSMSYESSCLYT